MLDAVATYLSEPSARGLALAVSRAVHDGALTPGEQLPPIRTVATQVGLSPTTVSAAWAMLVRAGTIRTDGRRGTVVADQDPSGSPRYRRALERRVALELDLSAGVPVPDLLPDLRPALRRLPATAAPSSYLDEPVLPQLLTELRAQWPFDAEAWTIVDGAMDALELLTRSTVRFGDRVAVDNPCFPPLLDLLESVGAQVVGVDQDDDGPTPSSLAAALDRGVTVVYLQPRGQNPTGASLSAGRARALGGLLAPSGAWVIENDSCGAISTSPLHSLHTYAPDRVVHIRSFSKSHGPDLRLAAVGGPAAMLDRVSRRRALGQGWTSRLLQLLLAELLSSAVTQGEVERAREEYARRRAATVAALHRHGVEVPGHDGLNIWVPVDDETAALLTLAGSGVAASAGSPFVVGEPVAAHIRITTALLRTGHDDVAALIAAAARAGGWTGPR